MDVLDLIARAERCAHLLQVQALDFIVCHFAIHAWNLLIDTLHHLYERIVQDIWEFGKQLLLTDEGGEDREQSLRYLMSNFLPDGTIASAYASDQTECQFSLMYYLSFLLPLNRFRAHDITIHHRHLDSAQFH